MVDSSFRCSLLTVIDKVTKTEMKQAVPLQTFKISWVLGEGRGSMVTKINVVGGG
ncbi:MAG: hypothetical protein ACM3YE_15110 [Bacteroidota bacterium]